jgi:DNA-binding NarL/FixJ family response regulator
MGEVRHVLHDFHLAYCNVQLAAAPTIRLAPGDQEVLAGVAAGRKIEVVGYELGITGRAVEERLARARRQLGCRTTTEAVAKAVTLGFIL